MNHLEVAFFADNLGMAVLGVLTGIPSFAIAVAAYVLTSLALFTLANRRGISHAWLSWIPVLNIWIIGSLSDQYRYVVKGQVKSKRKLLLTLEIIKSVLALVCMVIAIVALVNLVSGAVYGVSEGEILETVMGALLGVLGLALPMAGVAIAAMVIRYMALYDIYTSCDPANSVLFLVLSILFGITEPFFLFFSRTKDLGMPPRKSFDEMDPDFGEYL